MNRVGPHNLDVISVIVGLLLGDGWAEKRGMFVRIHFHTSSRNAEYLNWLHNFFYDRGYCSNLEPNFSTIIGKKNKIYCSVKFRTWSYSSFNFLYDLFYYNNGKKYINENLQLYLNAQALAIMFMDAGSRHGSSIVISTNCFSYEEQNILCNILLYNFGLRFNIHKRSNYVRIHLIGEDFIRFKQIVFPYMLKGMLHKLEP